MKNQREQDESSDIICRCSGTTLGHIRRYVNKGLADLDSISRASGACSGCGGCESDLLALIAALEKPHAEPVPE